jgi:hypothetical protein
LLGEADSLLQPGSAPQGATSPTTRFNCASVEMLAIPSRTTSRFQVQKSGGQYIARSFRVSKVKRMLNIARYVKRGPSLVVRSNCSFWRCSPPASEATRSGTSSKHRNPPGMFNPSTASARARVPVYSIFLPTEHAHEQTRRQTAQHSPTDEPAAVIRHAGAPAIVWHRAECFSPILT